MWVRGSRREMELQANDLDIIEHPSEVELSRENQPVATSNKGIRDEFVLRNRAR